MSFKFLKHIADIKASVNAESLENLFREALEGMAGILKKDLQFETRDFKNKKIIEIKSPDKTALLIDFLSEVLAQSQINKEVYASVNFLEFSETFLKAEIYGTPVENFDEDIKAVTYHEADVKRSADGKWETILLFDV